MCDVSISPKKNIWPYYSLVISSISFRGGHAGFKRLQRVDGHLHFIATLGKFVDSIDLNCK